MGRNKLINGGAFGPSGYPDSPPDVSAREMYASMRNVLRVTTELFEAAGVPFQVNQVCQIVHSRP